MRLELVAGLAMWLTGVPVALGAGASDGGLESPPSVTLAEEGKTDYVIALADDATTVERNAARELAEHLELATSATFAIVTPQTAGRRPVIAVGPGAAAALAPDLVATLDRARLGDDGIVMATRPPHLILSGAAGSKRGTLYAVYSFLEEIVGVRWWTSRERDVSRRPTLIVAPLDKVYAPPIRSREVFYSDYQTKRSRSAPIDETRAEFAARRKVNGHFTEVPADWGGGYPIIGWCHTFQRLIPPERYFAAHPEWFSELKGKRTAEHSQLCLSNGALVAELTKNALQTIRDNPGAGMLEVSQNDWGGNCQCAACRAIDQAEGSPSGLMLRAVNRVAEAVEQQYPDMLVSTLAYQYTRQPPKLTRPRPNVIVRLAVIERSGSHPLDSEPNRALMNDLKAWSAVAPNLAIWDYVANLSGPLTPHPTQRVYAPDIRAYAANHAIAVFCQGNDYSVVGDFDELDSYLMAQLLWDPSHDENAIVDDFLGGYYGAAGPALRKYLDLLADRLDDARTTSGLRSWNAGPDADWLGLATMNRATALMRAAEAAVAGDATRLARVRRARLQLDHQWIRGYAAYAKAAAAGGGAFDGPRDVVAAAEDLIARCRALGVEDFGHPVSKKRPQFDEYAEKLLKRARDAAAARP